MLAGMQTQTMPTLIAGGNGNDGFLGGGGLGGILIGALLGGGLFGGGIGGRNGYGMDGGAARSGLASEIAINPTLTAMQNQISNLQASMSASDITEAISGVSMQLANSGNNINNTINSTTRDLQLGQAGISTAIATGSFTTLNSINGLGRDVTAQANQNALAQLNSFNNLATTTLQGFNSNAMQMQNSTNQIIAQGTANAQAMAECCCAIKGAIAQSTQDITGLITSNRIADLQAQLNDAKTSNTILMQTNALEANNALQTSTILQHLRPFSTTSTVI